MIKLTKKQDCCGCTACMSVCPQHCITMQEDREGFLYPVTDSDACINCKACNNVCPVIKLNGQKRESYTSSTKAYASAVTDEIVLLNSSSGGLFSAIATSIINDGGVVYGAAWVNSEIHHIAVESVEELAKLRGSKYVQSSLDGSFVEIRDYLSSGRRVLFSGTPCQIVGLRAFLRKDYDNLFNVEVACHGAPSPKVLRKYIQVLREQYGDDVQLNFRSKPDGWKQYKVTAFTENKHYFYEGQKENLFMKGFLHELYSRPICQECPFKAGASGADITLADFWGIENVLPEFPSYNGASLVLTHTMKAERVFHGLHGVITKEVELEKAIRQNGALLHSEEPHPEREYFFKHIDKKPFVELMDECLELRRITRLRLTLKAYLRKIGIK